jgi:transcriptional regulator with XRE-family HTH domain
LVNDSLHRKFARRLRSLRTDLGLTQERLAERADLSTDAIRRLERGGFSPTLRVLEQIARALSVPMSDLLGESGAELSETHRRLNALLAGRRESEISLVLRLARAALVERD